MNFSVFESLAGNPAIFYSVFAGLFVGIVMWRVGASVVNSFHRLGDGKLSVDDWLWNFLKVITFMLFCGGFLYLTK